ncbi:phosphatase PAP2 family protein [Candidatus Nomurabacteria bacterium]|nr:phosphatase PAP2 family protein [Candidatus Nomurabacteria bacterium]
MIITSVIALPLILIITQITSHFYYDPRPFVVGNFTPLVPHDPDNGFPSDHTLLTMYVAALVYPHTKKIAYLLLVLAIMVGLSRVYVGIHHLTDVVGSTVIVLVAISGAYYLCDQKLKSISLPWLQ